MDQLTHAHRKLVTVRLANRCVKRVFFSIQYFTGG
jgi:hypothetical protein